MNLRCMIIMFFVTYDVAISQIVAPSVSGATVNITSIGTDRYDVQITPISNSAVIVLDSDGTSDTIRRIQVQQYSGGLSNVQLVIRDRNSPLVPSPIVAIEEIGVSNSLSTCLGIPVVRIDGNLGKSSSLTGIVADSISEIDIGGDLYAEVFINLDSSGTSLNTDISIGGSVLGGRIINRSAIINSINVAGNVSSIGGRVPLFYADSGIGTIDVGGNFTGAISRAVSGGAPGDVGDVLVGGDFFGDFNVRVNSLGSFRVEGDVDMPDSIIVDSIVGGVKTEILIGGSLDNVPGDPFNRAFLLPSAGLAPNSIINFNDMGGGFGAVIGVGIRGLLGDYTRLSGDPDVAGGSIGLAPFNFHQRVQAPPVGTAKDCDPYQTETVVVGSSENFREAKIWHYGPVYCPGTGPHFRVEYKLPFAEANWQDRTHLFKIKTTQTGTDAASAQRNVVIRNDALAGNTTGFKSAGIWRIRPLAGKVLCGNVSGNPDVEYDSSVVSGDLGSTTGPQYSWYTFNVELEAPPGYLLLQDPGGPTPSDLLDWANAPYEVNADGQTDSGDFVDLVEAAGGS